LAGHAASIDGVSGPFDLERRELDSGRHDYRLLAPVKTDFGRQLRPVKAIS
jgi:hypothetical protein